MLNTLGCIAIILSAIFMLFRRVEVRLVLLTASVALFTLAGQLPEMVEKMASELTKPGTVIPICASMGFAYALRATECDKHLVQLLLRPLERPVARALLIPGCIVVGYIVNMAIVSQSGAVAVVGSIAVPLLLQKGISRVTVGSLLLLGTSMGGELFNPAAVETVTLSGLTKISSGALAYRSIPLNVLACATALLVYWWLASVEERKQRSALLPDSTDLQQEISSTLPTDGERARLAAFALREKPEALPQSTPLVEMNERVRPLKPNVPPSDFAINPLKAVVPFVPLLLLFGAAHIPLLKPFHDHVTILVAMLIGCVAAGLASPAQAGGLASAFFEGMGFAYSHVISVTVCATLFAEGIKANGLIQRMVGGLAGRPTPALLASLVLPWGLAALSGSGAGAASSMMRALVPSAAAMHLNAAQMGILTAMGSHFGRTMSPAAAVAILCATLVSTKGATNQEIGTMTLLLTRRVAPPLFAGGLVLFVAALLGVGR